jgi:UDP-N-acetylmuramoylalanine--D-glutamate ligase
VRVADTRDNPPNVEALAAVAPGAELVAGAFVAATFAGVDVVALSPGVALASLPAVDVPVISEIELFAAGVSGQVPGSQIVAITGSNGKTTTTALTAHLLNGAGVPAIACGNISPSALDALMDALDAGSLPQVWVLELSSFQLETTHHLNAAAATVLNVSEDHLDRYDGSLANYRAASRASSRARGAMIPQRDDDWSMANGRCGRKMLTFGLNPAPRGVDYGYADGAIFRGQEKLVAVDELQLTGLHNAANAMAALALCECVGVAPVRVLPALKAFKGLPHRVEPSPRSAGVLYVTFQGTQRRATLAAIEGIGGKSPSCSAATSRPGFLAAEAALKSTAAGSRCRPRRGGIGRALEGPGADPHRRRHADAVRGLAAGRRGDCVLCPGLRSLDMYKNYAHRAQAFIDAVRELQP